MIHDDSTVKAIIKRGITDHQFVIDKLVPKLANRYSNAKSRKSTFKIWMDSTRVELENTLILEQHYSPKYFQKRHAVTFLFLDLTYTLAECQAGTSKRYPDKFRISLREVDKKLAHFSDDDTPFIYISTHCLERIVRRSQCENLASAIKILGPVCQCLFLVSAFIIFRIKIDVKYVMFWADGYLVIKKTSSELLPIVLTWLPRNWFTNTQTKKLSKLARESEASNRVFFIREEIFDSKEIIELEDDEFWLLESPTLPVSKSNGV